MRVKAAACFRRWKFRRDFFGTIREAWDKSGRFGPLSEHEIVLTVPASFDEEARELTVSAASEAGLHG